MQPISVHTVNYNGCKFQIIYKIFHDLPGARHYVQYQYFIKLSVKSFNYAKKTSLSPYSRGIEWFIEDQVGPGFLAVVWFGDLAPCPPPSSLSRHQLVFLFLCLPLCRWPSLWGGGGQDGRGAKPYEHEKTWLSINHSILSGETGAGILEQSMGARYLGIDSWAPQKISLSAGVTLVCRNLFSR